MQIDFHFNDCLSITEKLKDTNQRPSDCTDLELSKGNGMYKIYPKHSNLGFYVYCDLETDNVNGGWTVIRFIKRIIKLTRNIYMLLNADEGLVALIQWQLIKSHQDENTLISYEYESLPLLYSYLIATI